MRVGVLGPLLIVADDGTTPVLTGGRLRVLLAALAVRANQIVSVDELIEFVWDGAPPAAAARSIRVYVTRLRQALAPELAARLVTHDPGYLWRADPHETDLLEFEALCRDGGDAADRGDWATAGELLTRALELWRGTPLIDVPSDLLRAGERPRLDRLRLHAKEDRVEADLHLGRHRQVVAELRELVDHHPLRERAHAQLMRALAGAGEPAEALAAYERARRTLADELGVDPGAELRDLHGRLLAGDLTPAAARSVPRQLPPDVRNFTGRAAELSTLDTLLDSGAVVISAIDGTAGVGKTALAVHWARAAADRFPDGQLYVNLRGYDPDRPVPAGDALAGFLRALGVPGTDIPVDTAERAVRYRSLMTGRRMVVVADNAGAADQVRPLLPGAPGSVLLVTSRNRLAGLVARDGARRLNLDTLSTAESVRLLGALIGDRVDADPAAATALAELCAHLPLALRVVAELAVSRPSGSLATLVTELTDRQRRLDLLDADGDPLTSVRAVFSWSYQQLTDDQARVFRLLGPHPGPDLDVRAAAAAAGTTPEAARPLLAALVAAHLVVEVDGRYGMHDLLRAYALELAAADQDAVRRRLAEHYLDTAAAAMRTLFPAEHDSPGSAFDDPGAARAWLDAERANLVAVSAHADVATASRLASVLFRYFDVSGHRTEALAVYANAREAARRAGDRGAEADALVSIADVHRRRGGYQDAEGHLREALAALRKSDDQRAKARVWATLATIEVQYRRRYHLAIKYYGTALGLYRTAGNHLMAGFALNGLADAELMRDHHNAAAAYFAEALALFRELAHPIGEASVLDGLGELALRRGEHEAAIGHYEQALALFRAAGDPSAETYSRNGLGKVRLRTGEVDLARAEYTTALDLAVRTGDKLQEAHAHAGLGAVATTVQDDAEPHWRAALALYTELGMPEADDVRAKLA